MRGLRIKIKAINKLQNITIDINVFGTSVFAGDPRRHAARDVSAANRRRHFCTANLRNVLLKISVERKPKA
jgi:hypothetical protein